MTRLGSFLWLVAGALCASLVFFTDLNTTDPSQAQEASAQRTAQANSSTTWHLVSSLKDFESVPRSATHVKIQRAEDSNETQQVLKEASSRGALTHLHYHQEARKEADLTYLRYSKNLRYLKFSGDIALFPASFEHIGRIPNLEHLVISNCI